MSKRIIEFLLYLLLMLFPFGVLFRIKLYQNINIVPQDIVILLIFLFSIPLYLKNRKKILSSKFIFFQVLFLISGFLSLIINYFIHNDINLTVSISYAFRYLLYLNLFNMSSLITPKLNLKKGLFISGVGMLVLGFVQFFFYSDLRYVYNLGLGWDNHLARLFSSFLDPNYAGVFYVVFFFFTFSDVLSHRLKKSYMKLLTSFFILIAIFATYSRTALVSLIAGITAISLLSKKIVILLISIIVIAVLLVVVSNSVIEGLNPLRTASTNERLTSLSQAVSIIRKNIIIGVGFNTYRYAQVRYGFRSPMGAISSNADAGTDNSYLLVLATTGIVGFTFYILSYAFLLKKLMDERKKNGYMPISILVSLLTGCLFLNVLFYTPILMYFYLILSFRNYIFTADDK